MRLIRLLVETERVEDACILSTEAVSVSGQHPEIRNMAGKCYVKAGRFMDALHEFEKSILLIREGNFDAYLGLCTIYRIAGAQNRVEECLKSIEPLFSGEKRYLILRRHFLNENIEIKDFESELEELRKTFFRVF